MKRQIQTELPRFIVGALATAGASAANGATVQITFGNNYVSSVTGLSNFVADLTGDNVNEGLQAFNQATPSGPRVSLLAPPPAGNGGIAAAGSGTNNYVTHRFAWARNLDNPVVTQFASAGGSVSAWGMTRFTFSDEGINGGLATLGLLEVEARVTAGGEAIVQIHRLIYDNESTAGPLAGTYTPSPSSGSSGGGISAVPEASTSLGLLALGAGGILTRRRQKRAA